MPQRALLLFLTLWGAALLVFGSVNVTKAVLAFHNDYYWTPTTRHESLDQRKGRFEVYVGEKLLERRLHDGELAVRSGNSWLPLQEADVTIRLNHIGEVTRTWLLYGVGFASAGLALLVAALVIRAGKKGEESSPSRPAK
jgi:hypothetical protein